MPDPKLKVAMAEIETILRKNDIAGVVVLVSKTHTEFMHHIFPSWSCAKLEGQEGIRIQCKRADFPSREAQQECLGYTISMLAGFVDVFKRTNETMLGVLRLLGERVDFSHTSTFEDTQSKK